MPGSWPCVVSEASSSAPGEKSSGRGDHWALPAGSPWATGKHKSSGCKPFWCTQGVVINEKKQRRGKIKITANNSNTSNSQAGRLLMTHRASSGFRRKLQAVGWMGQRRTVRISLRRMRPWQIEAMDDHGPCPKPNSRHIIIYIYIYIYI